MPFCKEKGHKMYECKKMNDYNPNLYKNFNKAINKNVLDVNGTKNIKM